MKPETRYDIALENGHENYEELEPLYRGHYREMKDRFHEKGIDVGEYAPRLDSYFNASKGGWLLNYVVRCAGKAVGYSNVYLTNDMHNGEMIAQEDTIYILPAHRNGIGKKLVRHILEDLKERGVCRVTVTPSIDLRVAKVWARMGFKEVATVMQYTLKE